MKSYAPARIAPTAVSRLPNAVTTITGTSGRLATMRSHSARPSMPRMRTSVTTTSTSWPSQQRQGVGSRGPRVHPIPSRGESGFEELAHRLVVVDDEDAGAHEATRATPAADGRR